MLAMQVVCIVLTLDAPENLALMSTPAVINFSSKSILPSRVISSRTVWPSALLIHLHTAIGTYMQLLTSCGDVGIRSTFNHRKNLGGVAGVDGPHKFMHLQLLFLPSLPSSENHFDQIPQGQCGHLESRSCSIGLRKEIIHQRTRELCFQVHSRLAEAGKAPPPPSLDYRFKSGAAV